MPVDRSDKRIDELMTMIAKQRLDIPDLIERRMDSLDFHEVHIVALREALHLAYNIGRTHGALDVMANQSVEEVLEG